jgi:DNA-binding MltR family transcriptional regulator
MNKRKLKELEKLKEVNLNEFSEMMAKESDRACALLGSALLDAKLESIFRQSFKSYENELLGNFSSPLSTFSARIVLARALNWIDDAAYHDLNKIREIRNEFAHSFDHELSFGDQSISDRCSLLKIVQSYIDGYDQIKNKPENHIQFGIEVIEGYKELKELHKPVRKRYEMTIHFLSQYLEDMPAEISAYNGSNILEAVHSLSANSLSRFSIKADGCIVKPEENSTNVTL